MSGYLVDKYQADLFRISLDNFDHGLSKKELGELMVAFDERFPFWSLVAIKHIEIEKRNNFILYVTPSYSQFNRNYDGATLDKDDAGKMLEFINGFKAACKFANERAQK